MLDFYMVGSLVPKDMARGLAEREGATGESTGPQYPQATRFASSVIPDFYALFNIKTAIGEITFFSSNPSGMI